MVAMTWTLSSLYRSHVRPHTQWEHSLWGFSPHCSLLLSFPSHPLHGLKFHLNANDFQIYFSSPDISPQLRMTLPNTSRTELLVLCSSSPPSALSQWALAQSLGISLDFSISPLPLLYKITVLLRYNLHPTKFAFLKCTIQWVLAYSKSCATITTV